MDNNTIIQFFHWYYPADGSLWKHAAQEAPRLQHLGFTHIWLPPAYKSAWGVNDPGYAVYDLFDLGEFDQKGTVPTKYGTKDEYLQCIKQLQQHGLQVIADIVLNHKIGGDEEEAIKVKQVTNLEDMRSLAQEPAEIKAFTRFTFPGRKDKYSNFKWDWHSFTGTGVYTQDGHTNVYAILNEYGEGWEEMLDDEKGNFDFLMGNDIEFRNPAIREELKWWGKWYIETTGINGLRLDAVKHMPYRFLLDWLNHLRDVFKKDLFCIAEYWNGKVDILLRWCDAMENKCQLFDVPLHYRFYEASQQKEKYDLTHILDDTMVRRRPERAITFIDNHDSQPCQSMESFVEYWFRPLANAIILLRQQGIPCIFYPCMYGAKYEDKKGDETVKVEILGVPGLWEMVLVRKHLAYGDQQDYFDHPNVIGWVRRGIPEKEHSGCAVVISNADEGFKRMDMGKGHAKTIFIDITGHRKDKITTDENGCADFRVNGQSVSIWVHEAAAKTCQI